MQHLDQVGGGGGGGNNDDGSWCEIFQGNLRLAVMLPEGEDLNEWIAVNTVDFFNQINMLYGTITEFCTEQSCPVMSAGPKYEVSSPFS